MTSNLSLLPKQGDSAALYQRGLSPTNSLPDTVDQQSASKDNRTKTVDSALGEV